MIDWEGIITMGILGIFYFLFFWLGQGFEEEEKRMREKYHHNILEDE